MDYATGALASLMPKLVELLKGKYKLPPDMKQKVHDLEKVLVYVHADITTASLVKSAQLAEKLRPWSDVRELSYDMEDVVDTFLLHVDGSDPAPDIERLKELILEMSAAKDKAEIDSAKLPSSTNTTDLGSASSTTTIEPGPASSTTTIEPGPASSMATVEPASSTTTIEPGSATSPTTVEPASSTTTMEPGSASSTRTVDSELASSSTTMNLSHPLRDIELTDFVGIYEKRNAEADLIRLMFGGSSVPAEFPSGTYDFPQSDDEGRPRKILKKSSDSDSDEEDLSNKKPKIMSVVGYGGLGKTTLVNEVYKKVKHKFRYAAFVSVGQKASGKRVLTDILIALGVKKEGLRIFDEIQLINRLSLILKGKRYIIVIDDLWEDNAWKIIECAFSDAEHNGSQVITTTRDISIAEACCHLDLSLIYHLAPLSDIESQTLFCKRIFPQEGGRCPPKFSQVSAQILKKCGGMPLAIITIASLLASDDKGIKPIEKWHLLLNSIGHGLAECTDENVVKDMHKILSLSYYDLTPELKTCLLYLSMFPEDREIEKDRLIWRWIAEGFVRCTSGSVFEVGEYYFSTLINRSMIQPVYDEENEETPSSCRVHDMVLDLLCTLSTEANFVTILDGTQRSTPNSAMKIRRLSIQTSKTESKMPTQLSTTSIAHMRSFNVNLTSCSGTWDWKKLPSHVITQLLQFPDPSTCPVLRVLDIEDYYLTKSKHWDVKALLNLTYLGINMSYVIKPYDSPSNLGKIVMRQIGKLKFLRILDTRYSGIKSLPESVIELRQLICLRVDGTVKLPPNYGGLDSLEVLTHVVVSVDAGLEYMAEQLGRLTKLRVLGVTTEANLDENLTRKFIDALNKLVQIRSLKYIQSDSQDSMEQYSFKPSAHLRRFYSAYCTLLKLPGWISSSNISCMNITVRKLVLEDIEILGEMKCLHYLTLESEKNRDLAPLNHKFEYDAFPVAVMLKFDFTMLLPCMFPKGAMPLVRHLKFKLRPEIFTKGEYLNLDMSHLTSLKKVEVSMDVYRSSCQDGRKEGKTALRKAGNALRNGATLSILEPVYMIREDSYEEDESESDYYTTSDSSEDEAQG